MTLVKNAKNKILYGTDPECESVYLKDGVPFAIPPYWFRKIRGVHASDDPRHPVFIQGDGYKIHEDGANWEFAIRPSFNPVDLFQTIQEAAKVTSEQILRNFPEDCLPELQFLPTVNWDVQRWEDMPEDFFMSTRFGCDPDEDVTALEVPAREIDARFITERYCGGHLHVSGSQNIATDPHLAVRCMIITAGLAAVAFSDVPDLDKRRTFLYGKPGKFRIQNYGMENPFGENYSLGIEYRTPSCRWAGNWNVAKEVLKWAEIGIVELLDGGIGEKLFEEIRVPAIDAILECNQPLARTLLSHVESRL